MKRFLMIALAVLMGVTLVTTVFAQTTTEKATKAATDAVKAAGEKAAQPVAEKAPTAASPEQGKAPAKAEKSEPTEGPCKQVLEACKTSGFAYGEAKKGHGLYKDCVNPIMQGKTKVPGAAKPLPSVDPKLVSQCKAKNPEFGQGPVGSK